MDDKQESAFRFEKVTTHAASPDLAGFYVLDEHLKIIFWSKTAENSTGICQEEAVGKNILEVKTKNIESRKTLLNQVLKRKEQVSFMEMNDENNAWLRISIFPEKSHLFVMFRDVSEDLKIEGELKSLRNLKKQVLNSLKDAIWAIDTEYKLLLGNEAYYEQMYESTGRRKKLGESVLQDQLREDEDNRRRMMWKSAYDKALKGSSNRIVVSYSMNGEPRFFQADLNPIKAASEKEEDIIGVACFSREITERRNHLLSIKEQNENLREIAWMNSHKVRAPLANILGLTDLIVNHEDDIDEIKKIGRFLLGYAEELDNVVREVSEKASIKK